jgi:hypothetical protein
VMADYERAMQAMLKTFLQAVHKPQGNRLEQ